MKRILLTTAALTMVAWAAAPAEAGLFHHNKGGGGGCYSQSCYSGCYSQQYVKVVKVKYRKVRHQCAPACAQTCAPVVTDCCPTNQPIVYQPITQPAVVNAAPPLPIKTTPQIGQ